MARPKGGHNKRRSKLRSLEVKLDELLPSALKVIEDAVNGEDEKYEKGQLDIAKWVVDYKLKTTKGAVEEEKVLNDGLDFTRDKDKEVEEEEDELKPIFSLNVVK